MPFSTKVSKLKPIFNGKVLEEAPIDESEKTSNSFGSEDGSEQNTSTKKSKK